MNEFIDKKDELEDPFALPDFLDSNLLDVFNDEGEEESDESLRDRFYDTHMVEPKEEIYFDTSEKILKLNDYFSEEIVKDSIEEQLNKELDPLVDRLNYVKFFREKYEKLDDRYEFYDIEITFSLVKDVIELVDKLFREKYSTTIYYDLDVDSLPDVLANFETLYEFLFIRQYENLVNYVFYNIKKNKKFFVEAYRNIEPDGEEEIFLAQMKKKFVNEDDAIIIHFIVDIINDIAGQITSGYTLFNDIVNLDYFEEYNYKTNELLINLGNKLSILDDTEAGKKYVEPLLKNSDVFSSVKNEVLMKYLETCEILNK